jgi:N-hydroxyarylamine O-acetyltransferase
MTEWGSGTVQLLPYLQRIGLDGQERSARPEPTAQTLIELHRAHVLSIPFENIDVLLGAGVDLSVGAINDKLIRRRRGGVCHEHNLLFAAVLEQLGFRVRRVLTRVRDDGVALLPRGHSALLVDVDGQRWLCDVGYGCDGIIEPVPLSRSTVHQGQWSFEIEPGEGMWRLRAADPPRTVLYSVADVEYRRPDFDVAAYFLLTHPASPFSSSLVVQRATPDARYALRDLDLTVAYPDGRSVTERIAPRSLADVLCGLFAIDLGEESVQTALAFIESNRTRTPVPL